MKRFVLALACIIPGSLVGTDALHDAMDWALANGWEPIREADAPPNSPGVAVIPHQKERAFE